MSGEQAEIIDTGGRAAFLDNQLRETPPDPYPIEPLLSASTALALSKIGTFSPEPQCYSQPSLLRYAWRYLQMVGSKLFR